MKIARCVVAVAALFIAYVHAAGQEKEFSLTIDQSTARDEMVAPTSIDISPDGEYLYVAAWNSGVNVVFKRDVKTGGLTHQSTVSKVANLNGCVATRLNPAGDLAASASFRSKSLTLFAREKSGDLALLDQKVDGKDDVTGLEFPVDLSFTPDGRFVYCIDSNGGLTSFRVTGEGDERKLEFVEALRDKALLGARGVAFAPSGDTLFVTAQKSDSLVVIHRDSMSGKAKIVQVLREGEDDIHGFDGVFSVAVAPAGDFVYTTSGRFGGDTAFGVFHFEPMKEKLTLVQEIIVPDLPADHALRKFAGGNEIVVDADGERVYAVATLTNAVASFLRDKKTGKLTFNELLQDGGKLGSAAGLAVSKDGKFVYVAAEGNNAITLLKRE